MGSFGGEGSGAADNPTRHRAASIYKVARVVTAISIPLGNVADAAIQKVEQAEASKIFSSWQHRQSLHEMASTVTANVHGDAVATLCMP